jgi:hypothetical protein
MSIEAHGIRKKFGSYTALDGVDLKVPPASWWRCSGPRARARRRSCGSSPASSSPTRAAGASSSTARTSPTSPPAEAQGGLRLPALRPLPAHDRLRERRLRPAGAPPPRAPVRRPRIASASTACSSWSSWTASPGAIPASSPAAAPAGGPRPRPGGRAQGPAARRALRGPRRPGPQGAAPLAPPFHDEIQLTTIFVTHDQEEALEIADEVVIMNKGTGRAGRHPPAGLRPSRPRPSSTSSSAT